MTKAEMHYLNCTDDNCELFACVARRDFQRRIDDLEAQIQFKNQKLEVYNDPYGAHSPDSCDDPTCSHF